MADEPVVSCVIPVYNDRLRLPRAVDSVLRQSVPVQVVLVDDCSTDGSRELIAQMARDDSRVVALPLPWNRGQGFARNIGVAVADAQLVTFLDQDDEHLSGWYETAVGLLHAHPDVAAVKGGIELADVPPGLDISHSDPRWAAMLYSPLWNVVVRKVVYQALGGCPTVAAYRTREGVEDATLVMALTRHFKVARLDQVATRHYVNPDGATAYYLRRSRVTAAGIEFLEQSDAEKSEALQQANLEFQRRAASNLEALQAPTSREAESGHWLARTWRRLGGRE